MSFVQELIEARTKKAELRAAYARLCSELKTRLELVRQHWNSIYPDVALELETNAIESQGNKILTTWEFFKTNGTSVAKIEARVAGMIISTNIKVGATKRVYGELIGSSYDIFLCTNDHVVIIEEIERAFVALASDPDSCVFWN